MKCEVDSQRPQSDGEQKIGEVSPREREWCTDRKTRSCHGSCFDGKVEEQRLVLSLQKLVYIIQFLSRSSIQAGRGGNELQRQDCTLKNTSCTDRGERLLLYLMDIPGISDSEPWSRRSIALLWTHGHTELKLPGKECHWGTFSCSPRMIDWSV